MSGFLTASPALTTVSNLLLVAGGGVVTMVVQTLADRRARKVAERDEHDKTIAKALAEIQAGQALQSAELARLSGRLDERDKYLPAAGQ